MLDKTRANAPKKRRSRSRKLRPGPGHAIEIHSISKWRGAASHITRFARNESLQTLIELALTIRHVKGHRKGKADDKMLEPLLQQVTVNIERGSVVGVIDIGGKSRAALIRILGNSEAPSTGVIRFFGKVAAFGQLGASAFPYMTCRENIEFGARLVGVPRLDIQAAMERVPKFSGLGEFLDMPLRRISKAKIADLGMSFACCLDYDILIADEIARARSETVQTSWQNYLAQAPGCGQTVILGSRNVSRLEGQCTHLLLIKATELLDYGPTSEIEKRHAGFLDEARTTPIEAEDQFASADEEDEDGEVM
ncbi:MAG: ABC transporter ATP-binding protein [Alphaproteobacteria bacterium]|nr:ABC transporter ATP-binding protein [Alphaproteobacteria bacterium]